MNIPSASSDLANWLLVHGTQPISLLAETESVPVAVTVLFALLLVALIVCLALEEILHAKKSIIAGAFAVVCLLLGAAFQLLPFQEVAIGSFRAEPVGGPITVEAFTEGPSAEPEEFIVDPVKEPADHSSSESVDDEEQHTTVLHVEGDRLSMPVFIPGIDWSVIAIILGSSLFVDVTSKSGLFTWIAIRATKLSRGDPRWLLYLYGTMTVVFSAVLNNVTAMIIVGSLTVVSLEKLGRRDKLLGFLLIEGLLTNVGGMLTLISSVPNIIVGTTANISFATFFIKSAPYVFLATIVTLWMGAWMFSIGHLKTTYDKVRAAKLVEGFDENDGVSSTAFFRFSTVMLVLFIVLIAGTSALPVVNKLGMGFVALSMATIMLLAYRSEVHKFYRAVDWDLIGFFMALFVVIYVMEHAGVLHWIGSAISFVLSDVTAAKASPVDATTLLVGSAAFSSVTDNIPLAAMLASILHELGAPTNSGLWWSVIFGANLGGNLTPIGSASTLVAVTIMHRHEIKMTFLQFVRLAAVYAVVQIALAVVYVILIVPLIPSLG